MPRMDGTGPEGKGSRSGRKLGNCVELSKKNFCKSLVEVKENEDRLGWRR
jgi:hypothetical protein